MNTDDLLILLAVSRHRTFSAAGVALGLNHTTIARRTSVLSKALGGPLLADTPSGWELTEMGSQVVEVARKIETTLAELPGHKSGESVGLRGLVRISTTEIFGVKVVAPAIALVHRRHPNIKFEVTTVTRPTPPYGPSADLDIGVTQPPSKRLHAQRILDFQLGLYASRTSYPNNALPETLEELQSHTPISYVESSLQIPELDLVDRFFPEQANTIGATNVLTQLELVKLGAGIGILPHYLTSDYPDLVRVLPSEAFANLSYWMVSRPETLLRPEVILTTREIIRISKQFSRYSNG